MTIAARKGTFVGVLMALLMTFSVIPAGAQLAPTKTQELSARFDDPCGAIYSLSRSGNSIRVLGFSDLITNTWGPNIYGVTKVWRSTDGSTGTYVGEFNTSSTGGANFPLNTSNRWITLALVEDDGTEWCRGLYNV